MKIVALLAIIACLMTSSLVQGDEITCKNHPIFTKAQEFMMRTVKDHDFASKLMESFIDEFSNATPKSKTAAELGVCGAFANQNSCCSEQMTKFFDKAATLSISAIQKSSTPLTKMINLIKAALKKHDCSDSIENVETSDIISKYRRSKIYQEGILTAKLEFTKVLASINRASLCSVCVGTDVVNSYIAGDKINIEATSLASFLKELDEAFFYTWSIIENGYLMNSILKEIVNDYKKQSCSDESITTLTDNVMEFYMEGQIFRNKDTDNSLFCNGLVLFNERTRCDTAQDGSTEFETYAGEYSPSPSDGRILADTIDSVSAATGVPAYVESETDDHIVFNGDVMVSFASFQESKADSSSTSMSRLHFIALSAIISFIFF